MSDTIPQLRPRCFYCDTLLSPSRARMDLPSGRLYGPCCDDLFSDPLPTKEN